MLSALFILRGIPGHIRSDNGLEFVAKAVREWVTAVGAKTAYIEPGGPWENGYCESFQSKLRDELLRGEIFCALHEAQMILESRRRHYNTVRPHSSLGYRPRTRDHDVSSPAGATANPELTSYPDHLLGAGQSDLEDPQSRFAEGRS